MELGGVKQSQELMPSSICFRKAIILEVERSQVLLYTVLIGQRRLNIWCRIEWSKKKDHTVTQKCSLCPHTLSLHNHSRQLDYSACVCMCVCVAVLEITAWGWKLRTHKHTAHTRTSTHIHHAGTNNLSISSDSTYCAILCPTVIYSSLHKCPSRIKG